MIFSVASIFVCRIYNSSLYRDWFFCVYKVKIDNLFCNDLKSTKWSLDFNMFHKPSWLFVLWWLAKGWNHEYGWCIPYMYLQIYRWFYSASTAGFGTRRHHCQTTWEKQHHGYYLRLSKHNKRLDRNTSLTDWAEHLSIILSKNHADIKYFNADSWGSDLIALNWKHVLELWNMRNLDTHGSTTTEKSKNPWRTYWWKQPGFNSRFWI